jgi:diaminopimelate epimerase
MLEPRHRQPAIDDRSHNRAMRIRFTKMHGAGNDFVMLNGIAQKFDLAPEQLRRLADRRFGVGADQILLVEPAPDAQVDFRYRIFNADGGEVEQCGNGARCFVKFVRDLGLTHKAAIRVLTRGGVIEPRLEADGSVTVDMGLPRFAVADVPFDSAPLTPEREGEAEVWPLSVAGGTVRVEVLSMGNPHAVQRVADIEAAPVATVGPLIEHHARFPARVNAGFAQVLDAQTLALRVWERGAGETLACGSGACAAAVSAIRRGWVQAEAPITVRARGGDLVIRWAGPGQPVFMSGPAETVYAGEIEL